MCRAKSAGKSDDKNIGRESGELRSYLELQADREGAAAEVGGAVEGGLVHGDAARPEVTRGAARNHVRARRHRRLLIERLCDDDRRVRRGAGGGGRGQCAPSEGLKVVLMLSNPESQPSIKE